MADGKRNGAKPAKTDPRAGGTGTLANTVGVVAEEAADFILKGDSRVVNLAELEKALTALWQAAGKPRPGEKESPVARACVLNLLILVEDDEGLNTATNLVAHLTWSYPSRAIVLVQKPNSPDNSINAWISTHCQVANVNSKKVCCEQITIEAHGETVNSMANIVLSLLVPDLPVILWTPGSPRVDSAIFQKLIQTCDRLIFDSRSFLMPALLFSRLTSFASENYSHLAFTDISWSRLTPWRGLTAQFFDIPEMRRHLQLINQIELDYEAPYDDDQPNFSEALLFVAWLATKLSWKPAFNMKQVGKDAHFILNRAGEPLNVYFHGHNDRKDDLGGITGIKIISHTPEDRAETVFSITLSADYQQAIASIMDKGHVVYNRNVLIPHRDQQELVMEDLGVIGHDTVYEQAALMAGEFAGFHQS
jgi:glucose-6-phosphate dehydrogenase assembly protein OpcA